MPRTVLTKTVAPGPYPAAGVAVTWNNGDDVNDNEYVMTGRELVLARNAHATLAKTITIFSTANDKGRTKSITAESLAANNGVVKVYGPFRQKDGWVQSGGAMHIDPESADVKIAVVDLGV